MEKLSFTKAKILVVGDIMVDKYIHGQVSRVSPEAPVPVVQVSKETSNLGGAANVAMNLVGLGAEVGLCGLLGKDESGNWVKNHCDESGVRLIQVKGERPTTSKQRIMGSSQQIVRLDFERTGSLGSFDEAALWVQIKEIIAHYDVLIISDYGKGVCTETLCQKIIDLSKSNQIKVLVDPKGTNWGKYHGANLVTPNFKEFTEACGKEFENCDNDIEKSTSSLMAEFNLENLLITRSEQGMTLAGLDSHLHIRAEAREVFDVSGAGDTVIAALGASLALGWDYAEAMRMANRAAGIVVAKKGTVPISIKELNDVVNPPMYSGVSLEDVLSEKKNRAEQKMVFTNGCFDILHRGHLEYLRHARQLGDWLVVGLNSDASVKKLKGENRPINNEDDRALLLSSLEFVDRVIIFDNDTPLEMIKSLKPEILVKGGDYKPEEVVGREFAKELVLIDFVDGYSSTSIINRLASQ
jgi:D-beta-D-heptose 7-phosphate kinase / D-beta-D-heptose 1-phosphate adenosyltransferase